MELFFGKLVFYLEFNIVKFLVNWVRLKFPLTYIWYNWGYSWTSTRKTMNKTGEM